VSVAVRSAAVVMPGGVSMPLWLVLARVVCVVAAPTGMLLVAVVRVTGAALGSVSLPGIVTAGPVVLVV
jgi:hypothetical protein